MATTGLLGTRFSTPGNIVLGEDETGNLQQIVNQVLHLEQQALANSYLVVVEQSITFNQTAVQNQNSQPASQSISFLQVAAARVDRFAIVSQSISFLQDAQGDVTKEGIAEDAISFAEDISVFKVVPRTVSQSISFTQDLTSNIKPVVVEQSLALVQTADEQGPIPESISHNLNLVQIVEARRAVAHLFVTNTMALVQSVGRTIAVSVSQSMSLTQTAERKNIVIHTLPLVQSVSVGKGGDVDQELGLAETVTRTVIYNRSLSDPMSIYQAATFYVERPCTKKSYSLFVGAGTDPNFPPPSTTVPTISKTTLTLTYPYVTPTETLILRNPSFGDLDRLNFNRINRFSRGGTLIVYADPKWPKTQTLVLQIDALRQQQAADLIDFIRLSLGQEIGLLDWENRQWRGVIVNPDATITHVGKNDRSVVLEFQGTTA